MCTIVYRSGNLLESFCEDWRILDVSVDNLDPKTRVTATEIAPLVTIGSKGDE